MYALIHVFIPARAFGAWQESSRMTHSLIRLCSYSGSCILLFYCSKGTEHLINLSQTYGSLSFLAPTVVPVPLRLPAPQSIT
jgi:hypothetical protein